MFLSNLIDFKFIPRAIFSLLWILFLFFLLALFPRSIHISTLPTSFPDTKPVSSDHLNYRFRLRLRLCFHGQQS